MAHIAVHLAPNDEQAPPGGAAAPGSVAEVEAGAGAGEEHAIDGRTQALNTVREFLNSKRSGTDPVLKIWFQHFDRHQTGRIDHKEFQHGMRALHYPYDADGLWAEIDHDSSDELFFEEIDAEQARTWSTFRRWCGENFQSPRDMILQLKRAYASKFGPVKGQKEVAFQFEVLEGLPAVGWEHGHESMLYPLLDLERVGSIAASDLKWLEMEARRCREREDAKKKRKKVMEQKANTKNASRKALLDFKAFLRSKHGLLFRAWRKSLDLDGTMTLQRAELFKVCRQMNWRGNVRSLWKALDPDGSGYCSFEELDPHGAQLLAQFWEWAVHSFGPTPSVPMWQALDSNRRKKVSYSDFAKSCEARGFHKKAHTVAACFDCNERRCVMEEDFSCLDFWHPPAWLVVNANLKAAQDFKSQLLNKYGRFVKAWRIAMDKDHSNSCNWTEFNEAAKHVKFSGDVAGAWRHFDNDFSGFITLQEIDPAAHDMLMDFKRWAEDEFGGVRQAFIVMDKDKSKQVTVQEFRSACRHYGFTGDVQRLFENLTLHVKEDNLRFEDVGFLDHWEVHERLQDDEDDCADGQDALESGRCDFGKKSFAPGPGAYSLRTGFGAGPVMPTAKHGGSFSFGKRWPELWASPAVGPGKYSPTKVSQATFRRKPAWTFNRAVHSVVPSPEDKDEDRSSAKTVMQFIVRQAN